MNALDPILEPTRAEVARRRRARSAEARSSGGSPARGREPRASFAGALAAPGLSVIAEHKRRSPSAGLIREGVALEEVVAAYERAGAAALSVLTEDASFGGSLEDSRAARAATALPILRKDFIVDPYQVPRRVAAGADAILLIVAALAPGDAGRAARAAARARASTSLVEVHDARRARGRAGSSAARDRSGSTTVT